MPILPFSGGSRSPVAAGSGSGTSPVKWLGSPCLLLLFACRRHRSDARHPVGIAIAQPPSCDPKSTVKRSATVKPLPDVLGTSIRVLFAGINPSLYSAERGHHYAGPGNRFWPALYGSGFTPRLFTPYEDGELPE